MSDKKGRIGRPPKTAEPGTRVSLGLKVTAKTKARIDTAARESGRTQSQEAEALIEEALARKDDIGGTELAAVSRLMAEAFRLGGTRCARQIEPPKLKPKEWINDPRCYEMAIHSVMQALFAQKPGFKHQQLHDEGHRILEVLDNLSAQSTTRNANPSVRRKNKKEIAK